MSEIGNKASPTPQQQQARDRMKQLLGLNDEELDARILKIAEAIKATKAAQPNATRLTPLRFTDTRKYYHVIDWVFETVVDARDAATPERAKIEAFSNPKQSWYFRGDSIPTVQGVPQMDTNIKVEEWDHNRFVDWLRR